jgi:uncharacterized protein (DUF2141 family)
MLILCGLSAGLTARAAEPAGTGVLRITVSNVRSGHGHVHVTICPQSHYLKDDCAYEAVAPAMQGETVAVLNGLPAGTYAAQVYFDENDNDRIDRTWIGIPEEGVGFSHDPTITFHAPSFAETSFPFDGVAGSITVRLRYF